jgi:hypothetical protein
MMLNYTILHVEEEATGEYALQPNFSLKPTLKESKTQLH